MVVQAVMSTPVDIGPVRPSFKAAADAPVDFGPDFSKTPQNEEKPQPKVRVGAKPAASKAKSPLGSLGQNKKMRSPVRKLTREAPNNEELSDLERLVNWYVRLGKMLRPFHAKLGNAMLDQAEDCALAWFELADNNDTVRRYVLAFIEGGAWGKVIAAHTPLFMAVLPEEVLTRFFMKGMGLFAQNMEPASEDEFVPGWPPS